MTTVKNTDPLVAKLPIGQMKYGKKRRNVLIVLHMEMVRKTINVKISKKARATSSLLKVLRRRICRRTMIMITFPKIPKTAITSLVKKSIHDANSEYSTLTRFPHSESVILFAEIKVSLVQASLVLILRTEENFSLGRSNAVFMNQLG